MKKKYVLLTLMSIVTIQHTTTARKALMSMAAPVLKSETTPAGEGTKTMDTLGGIFHRQKERNYEVMIPVKHPATLIIRRNAVVEIVSAAKAKLLRNNSQSTIERIMDITKFYSQQVVFMSSVSQVNSLIEEAISYMNNNDPLPKYVTNFKKAKY